MQKLLEMGVKGHEAWLKSDAYAPLTLDLDLVFE